MNRKFRCILHGSFSKHFTDIQKVHQLFADAGIQVLAPKTGELVTNQQGFGLFEDEINQDPRSVELLYLHNLKKLGEYGFSYFINPDGYIGKSASYELGIAQLTNTRTFFTNELCDHPAYIHKNSIWKPKVLLDYIIAQGTLPPPQVHKNDRKIHQLWQDLFVPGSVVATGAIIEHQPRRNKLDKEVLLVKTHKWGGRYSIVGGKVLRNERLKEALIREVKEETGLSGKVGAHLCTFDQIKDSGYYKDEVQHIFVDNIVQVENKKVLLNEEAQDFTWATPSDALAHLDIEPNARTTLEIYANYVTRTCYPPQSQKV